MSLLRPYGIVRDGELCLGLEVERKEGRITSIRPHTGIPDPYVLSVPFVNAHSHLEYRGLQGKLEGLGYWEWIRELTRLKALQDPVCVREDCSLAAKENRASGVGLIGEHSDRPFAGSALADAGIDGVIFQEVITFFEREHREVKLAAVAENARQNAARFQGPVLPSPHALYTVDAQTLRDFGAGEGPFSLHLAETRFERDFFARGDGPIADFYRANGVAFHPSGLSPLQTAAQFGLMREGAQFVHVCDLDAADIDALARSGATAVHCPRSNAVLDCPDAPVRELLDKGVAVGLGMDSAASSGPIDMFAEMRGAVATSERRGRPLRGEEVWRMATRLGAESLGRTGWDLHLGWQGPLIALDVAGAATAADLIEDGSPKKLRWIE